MAAANIGTITYNHHFANGLAAIFIACGQDVAYVTEFARTDTNTYFKKMSDGWIECVVGKI
jgi:hydroxymethylglutaryl-CoA reductase